MSTDNTVETTTNEEYKYSFHWDLDFSLNIGETNKKFFDELGDLRVPLAAHRGRVAGPRGRG